MTLFTPIIDVKHRHYCGPGAIALLTGVPVSRIEHMLRRHRGGNRDRNGRRLPIRGTGNGQVTNVLAALDCKVEKITVDGRPTLAAFVDDVRHAGTMLVEVTGHYMVCEGGMIADNSHPEPFPVEQYPKSLRRVKRAWKVTAPETPRYTVEDRIGRVPREPKPKPDIKLVRYERTVAKLKWWEARAKRAETAIRKLARQKRYYEKTLAASAAST